jgi:hypothetical protein
MKTSLPAFGLPLVFFVAIFAANSYGAESTGTYQGFIKCTVYNDAGSKIKTGKQNLILQVEQQETLEPVSKLRMMFNFSEEGIADGTQFDDAANPSGKASVGAVSCANNGDAFTKEFVANAELKKADAENETAAKLKGTLSYTKLDEHAMCKWKVKRSGIEPGNIPLCETEFE